MSIAPSDDALCLDEQLRSPAFIVQNVPESIIVTDLSGSISYWNEGATALFGYSAEEMLGRTPAVLYLDQEQADLTQDLTAIRAGRDYIGEWQGLRKDGTPIWIHVRTTPLRDASGVAIGFVGVARDITAHKRSEERDRLVPAATEALVATRDPGQTPQRIAELAVPVLADRCSVGMLEEDGSVLWLGMTHREATMPAPLAHYGRWAGSHGPSWAEGIFRDALRTGQTQLVTRVPDAQLQALVGWGADYLALLRARGPVSVVAVPLIVGGRLVGVIEYVALGEERAYTSEQLPLLEDLAQRAALALDTAHWSAAAQRSQAAAEARAHELEATFEAMTDGVIMYDREARMVRINEAARTLFAFDGSDSFTALPLEERARLARARDEAGRLLRPEELVPARVLRGEVLAGQSSATIRLTALDGRELMIEATGRPLRDEAGVVIGAVVLCRDVTERRAAEQALHQQAALLALAHDAIIVRSPEGTIVRWNAGAAALYGWTAAEAEGRVMHNLLQTHVLGVGSATGLAAGSTGRDIDALLAMTGAWEGTLEHARRDGTRIVVESRQALLRAESGVPVAILEINRDLTAREAFLSGIAHDLKTPLTSILGHAQLAARRLARLSLPEIAPAIAHLTQVEAGTRSLARLIDELADATRLQMGGMLELEQLPTDAVALVRALVAQQQGLTGHRLVVETTVPSMGVLLDVRRMERVLGNLLANAIKYSPNGSEISVRLALVDDERGPGVTIAVHDRGMGIPAADLPHIFERFHRGRNVVGIVSGTGLGLTSARTIVEQHGGAISVESVEGAGTTMRVWLPRTPLAGQSPKETDHAE